MNFINFVLYIKNNYDVLTHRELNYKTKMKYTLDF